MDYFADEGNSYRVKRKLIDTTLVCSGDFVIEEHEYTFNTFEKAFDCFEKMYKIDRSFYTYLTSGKCSNKFFDTSKKPAIYTFSIANKLLTVQLLGFKEIAGEVFCI